MILVLLEALAAPPIGWVDPPRIENDVLFARIDVEPGVGTRDLELLVDGQTVPATFSAVAAQGSTTLISFDASGSFRRHYNRANDLAMLAVDGLTSAHPVGLMAFGRQAHTWPATSDPEVLRKNLAEVRAAEAVQQETRLLAFILEGIDTLVVGRPTSEGGFRRLVVFTDAGEESTVFTPEPVIERARKDRVVVDLVVFARTKERNYAEDLDRLARIARETGGRVWELHDGHISSAELTALWAHEAPWIDVRAAGICGPSGAQVAVRGENALHSEAVSPGPSLRPCTADGLATSGGVTGAGVDGPAAAEHTPRTGLPSRGAGFACLIVFLLLTAGLIAMAWWYAGEQDRRRPAERPLPPPEPAPPTAVTPPLPSPPAPVEKDAFSMRLPERHLEVVGGGLPKGTRWRFAGRILRVGASGEDNDVVVDLPQVSSRHARFELFPSGTVFVEDLGSSNGTWLNGLKLTPHQRTEIPQGGVVAISSQLTLHVTSPSESA